MGLSDRDYMHERHAEGFGKPKSSRNHPFRSTLWMILTWVTVIFLLYRSFLWLESNKQVRKEFSSSIEVATPEPIPIANSRTYVPVARERSQQGATYESESSKPGTQTVTKCLLNGHVTFTDRKCPSGSKSASLTVNTANVGTVAEPTFEQASPPQIQQQVVTPSRTLDANNAASMRASACIFLEQRINQIDAMARQPLSGQSQDDLTAQRRKFRSRQSELHC